MRLSSALCYKFVKGIPGCIWTGANRFVPPVTKQDRLELWKKLMYEEEVMMYLRNPYLSEEEEKLWMEKNPEPFTPPVLYLDRKPPLQPREKRAMGFHLDHLNTTRYWK